MSSLDRSAHARMQVHVEWYVRSCNAWTTVMYVCVYKNPTCVFNTSCVIPLPYCEDLHRKVCLEHLVFRTTISRFLLQLALAPRLQPLQETPADRSPAWIFCQGPLAFCRFWLVLQSWSLEASDGASPESSGSKAAKDENSTLTCLMPKFGVSRQPSYRCVGSPAQTAPATSAAPAGTCMRNREE